MATNPYMAYKTVAVQTSSPAKLLLMLYDGFIGSMDLACDAIVEKRLADAHRHCMKAQNIVAHLHATLDMDFEISNSLASLYDYFYRRLVEANVNKIETPIVEILPIVKGLREAWYQASLQISSAMESAL